MRGRPRWSERRACTGPGPFDDVAHALRTFDWVRAHGTANMLPVVRREAEGLQGFGRPNEDPERRSYLLAALVAVWRGTWPTESIPEPVRVALPAPPAELGSGPHDARVLAESVLHREAELRMMWEEADDRGEGLRQSVATLKRALE